MKKLIVLFLALTMVTGFAMADRDGIGITVGVEFGADGVNKPDDAEDINTYLMPFFVYENSFFDGALDLFAEVDYTVGLYDENPMELYVDLRAGYNLFFGRTSTLSFLLRNEFDPVVLKPRDSEGNNIVGIFTPAVMFNQAFNFGDFYAKAGAPITYIQEDKDADLEIGLNFTAGWASAFGLGLELTAKTIIKPSDSDFYNGIDILAYFETGPVYFEVLAEIPAEMDYGISLTPYLSFAFSSGLQIYAYCELEAIAAKEGSIVISPAVGVKFSF